jgi:hypothetical protein
MNAVNELGCDFAITVLTKIKKTNQLEPSETVRLIKNFYTALMPLMQEINHEQFEDLNKRNLAAAAPSAPELGAKANGSGH